MAILFISNLVPDSKEYWTTAFTRAAQNVLRGIAKELPKYDDTELVCCRPIASFPNGPIWIPGETAILEDGQKIHVWPTLNIVIVKNIFWGIYSLFFLKKWAKKYKKENRRVLVYNIYTPPIDFVYQACRWSRSQLFEILMDLGMPPKSLGLNIIRKLGYRCTEYIAHKYIPKLDGRIVINDRMVDEYAPDKDYILIDGGVNDQVINRLFPLKESSSKTITCVLAGMLTGHNGTTLIINTLNMYPELDVHVIFCGEGNDVPIIKELAKSDKRINYLGMLNMDELFNVYEKADVLFNLRIEDKNDMHFPSKLLECLTIGKIVLSTPIAHAERDYGQYMEILHDITPQGLANKLIYISQCSKVELFEKGVKARKFMLNNRRWSMRVKEIINYMNTKQFTKK